MSAGIEIKRGTRVQYFGNDGEAWDGIVSNVQDLMPNHDGVPPCDIVSADQSPDRIRSASYVRYWDGNERGPFSTGHYFIVDPREDSRSRNDPGNAEFNTFRRVDQLRNRVRELEMEMAFYSERLQRLEPVHDQTKVHGGEEESE